MSCLILPIRPFYPKNRSRKCFHCPSDPILGITICSITTSPPFNSPQMSMLRNRCTRSLTFELSPPRLYTLGFEAALKRLAEQMNEQYNIRCEFKDNELPKPMADEVKVLLYRIVRELLHNVAKHAAARKAKISLNKMDDNIRICVEDDGIGFDPSEIESDPGSTGGFGLFSVRERLNFLKGNLEIRSGSGRGTQAIVTVPLNPSVK